ncbi:MAG TPA: LapA family protein [Burkholderiales bacterium]|nr:LapA family protein [Burkholderiales bacterium]
MNPPMRYLSWIARILAFLLLLAFALKNSAPVTLRFYFGSQWEAPLTLMLLVFFCLGAAAGVAACLARIYRQRREILELRRDARARPGAAEDAT